MLDQIGATVALNNGVALPWLGLGTYMATGREAYDATRAALDVGYRHVDTAAFYDNEREVGAAIRDCGIPREEIFVTTKLWNDDHGRGRARAAFERSRERLDVGTIDLYLIHWPVPELRLESWETLEALHEEGRCRAVGVSNYTAAHLEELLARGGLVPAVNQVEMSPFLYQRDLIDLCVNAGIRIEAYSPLTKGERLRDPRLVEIARRHRRTPAQLLVRWCLEHGLVPLPKSSDPARILENAQVFDFELPPETMAALDALDCGLRTSWDPTHQA